MNAAEFFKSLLLLSACFIAAFLPSIFTGPM